MNLPNGLLFTKDHEWAKKMDDGTYLIGITDHAQSALGEVVFCELPQKGRQLKSHETFGVVESIKAVSDLYCPIEGTVVESNSGLSDNPGHINESPYEKGWLIRLKPAGSVGTDLMDTAKYKAFVDSLK